MAQLIKFTRPERGDVWVDPDHVVYVGVRRAGKEAVIYTTHPGETAYFTVDEPIETVVHKINAAKEGL